MPELSLEFQKLIEQYQKNLETKKPQKGVPTIHVDNVASRIAVLYEKIRQIIDWKAEHLVRRIAIERILKRMLVSEISGISVATNLNPEETAESLVVELIRGGHLANDSIPRPLVVKVKHILTKYIYILENCSENKIDIYHWLLSVAACEIEDILCPSIKEKALINCMTEVMAKAISVNSHFRLTDEEKWIQTSIAVHKVLFHLDSPVISYHLLCYYFPDWSNLSPLHFKEITNQIFDIARNIEKKLNHPLASHFSALCEQYDLEWRFIPLCQFL